MKSNKERLLGSFPQTPPRITSAVQRTLKQIARREEPAPPRRYARKLSFGAAALLALLLAAVALAVGLSYSPRYTAVQKARGAVMEKYGLTQDMLRLYLEYTEEKDGITTVRFAGSDTDFLKAKPMGDYMATVDGQGNVAASWTLDGVEPQTLENGDLGSDAWGPKQLQMLLDRYAYYQQWERDTPALPLLPIAEQARRVSELDEAVAPVKVTLLRTDLPEETDIGEGEALALAAQALNDGNGIRLTDGWRAERIFQAKSPKGRRYVFSFRKESAGDGLPAESYTVSVKSPSGEVTLGLGDITGRIAPKATEKAPVPAASITEEGALAAARRALAQKYGLTDDMLTLFVIEPTLDVADGRPCWMVACLPVDHENFYAENARLNPAIDWRWIDKLTEKLGRYQVRLDAENGATLAASWSLDGASGAYTQSDWATAEAYDASILPWALRLMAQTKPIADKYPDEQTEWFSVEDAAAYDQAFRDAGFSAGYYNHALPKPGELSAQEAKRIACEAMASEYGLTQADFARSEILCNYLLDNGGEWNVGFYNAQGMGSVRVNAATGEIQRVYLDAPQTGNG